MARYIIFFDDDRKRQYCLRHIVDIIRKVIRTGSQWQNNDSAENIE